jgi:hypothetical protein
MAQAGGGADPIRAALTKLFENPKFASIFRPEPNAPNNRPIAPISAQQAVAPPTEPDNSTTGTVTPSPTETGQSTPIVSTVQQLPTPPSKPALLIDVSSTPSSPKHALAQFSTISSTTDTARQLWEHIGASSVTSSSTTSVPVTQTIVSSETPFASLTTQTQSSTPIAVDSASDVPRRSSNLSESTLADVGTKPQKLEESRSNDKIDGEAHKVTESSENGTSDITIRLTPGLPVVSATVHGDEALSSPAVCTESPVRQLTTRLKHLRLASEDQPKPESNVYHAVSQKANIKPPPGFPAKPTNRHSIVVTEQGNLVLVMGEEKQANFIVDSKIISQASAPLKHVINAAQELESLRKHSSGGLVTVRLPEELPDAARTIFFALHGLPAESSGMTRDRLYRICILAHEYELTAALKSWWKLWLEQTDISQWDNVGPRLIRHLWIAHELGQEKDYCRLWALLVWRSSMDDKGRLLIDGTKLATGAAGGHGKQAKAMKGMLGELSHSFCLHECLLM